MKQAIGIGSIIELYRDVDIGDSSPLEVGDYVVVVSASHGWGDVKPGMLGKVVNAGRRIYDVDFGRYHSSWTGERSCFINVGKELSNDLLKQVEKNQNDDFLKKLEQFRDSGLDTFLLDTTLVIRTLRHKDVAKVRVRVPIRDIARLRTFKGFRNRVVQILASSVSNEVHPTRIEKVRELNALGYSINNVTIGELMKKVGGAVDE